MATKLQLITAIFNEEVKKSTATPDNWTSLLKTAANNYKYSFPDQVLIYAQKPNATACAEIELWNSRFDRWVNRGATGIALLNLSGGKTRLRYVFDVSDTNSSRDIEVPYWKAEERYTEDICEALSNAFGDVSQGSLAAVIDDTAKNLVEDNMLDYLYSLEEVSKDSFLEELDEENISAIFKNVLTSSIGYMMMTRCGIDADSYYSVEDFKDIYNFNTHETVMALGSATRDIADMGLREIEVTVKNLQKEEKNRNRTFVNSYNFGYDEGANKNIQSERSNENGTDNLQTGRRLSDTEHNPAERGEQYTWKVWTDEKEIPDEPQESDVQYPFDEGRTDETSDGSGSTSREDDGAVDLTDGTGTRSERESEGKRPDKVDSVDEQHSVDGGRNNTEGTDLQLSSHDFDARWNGIEYFHQDKEKNELIRTFLTPHKEEIATFYDGHSDRNERGDFVMSFFNSEPFEMTLSNDVKAGFEAYSDAIHLWRGDKEHPERETWDRWFQVADAVYGMILLEQWTEPEALKLPSVDNQIEFIGDKVKDGVLPLPQAAIDYILGCGSHFREGKLRVYQHFSELHTRDENIAFLKNEYGTGGGTDAIPSSGYWENHDSKGIEISDHYSVPERRILLKWNEVSKRLTELIKLDRYLSPKEKEMYPQWLENKLIKEAEWKKSNEIRRFIRDAPEEEQAPKEYRYDFYLGDTVYLGAEEYTILSLGDTVILSEIERPLFTKEITKENFERRVKETPANEHLRVEVEIERPITDNFPETEVDESNKPDFLIQYEQVKKENPDGVLLMHLGGFYFAFGEDAQTVTKYTHHTAPKKNFYGNVFIPCCQVLDYNLSYCQKELCENNNINLVIMEFDRKFVYNGIIICYDYDCLRKVFQNLPLYCNSPCSTFGLCR